ncbi:FAD linked oxidase [Amylostereum chailletii]|nr:FAD linked oxidase [Amylostereum chailletii]
MFAARRRPRASDRNASTRSCPRSRTFPSRACLPELVFATKDDMAKEGIQSTIVGHVGDGNFHALMLFKDEEELSRVKDTVHRLIERAIALGGTCTGEHGVGVGKEYLVEELGEGTVELMWAVKKAVDPHNIMNPGKVRLFHSWHRSEC